MTLPGETRQPQQTERSHRCALCGYESIEADSRSGCRGCCMASSCHLLRCPNCGYEVPVGPEMKRLKNWWNRVWRGKTVSSIGLVAPLSRMAAGQKGEVAHVHAQELEHLQKLTSMGILPGVSISVIQTFPAYVFQAGQTQFAVDRGIADAIYVRLADAGAVVAGNTVDSDTERRGGRQMGWRWGRHSD